MSNTPEQGYVPPTLSQALHAAALGDLPALTDLLDADPRELNARSSGHRRAAL